MRSRVCPHLHSAASSHVSAKLVLLVLVAWNAWHCDPTVLWLSLLRRAAKRFGLAAVRPYLFDQVRYSRSPMQPPMPPPIAAPMAGPAETRMARKSLMPKSWNQ